ncbi:unnamed protein product, partial [marine sediment metagenome]
MIVALGLIGSCANPSDRIPETVSYNFHVRPILSDKCFACHGPDENTRESELRLYTEAGIFATLKDDENRHVVTKSSPDLSDLYLRISSTD